MPALRQQPCRARVVDLERVAAWMDAQGLGAGPSRARRAAGRRHAERAAAAPPRRPRLRAAASAAAPAQQQQRDDAPRGARAGRARGQRRAAPAADRGVPVGGRDRRVLLPDGADPRLQRDARAAGAVRVGSRAAPRDGALAGRRHPRARPRRSRRGRVSPTSARSRATSSARRRAGARSSRAMPSSRAGRGREHSGRRARRALAGGDTARSASRPGILHGDYPPRERDVPLRRTRSSRRSSTGSCARSAIRCSTSAGCSPRGRPTRARRRARSPSTPWQGFPTADELIAHYRRGTTRDLSALVLVPRARLLQARDHPRGHARARLRRQGAEGRPATSCTPPRWRSSSARSACSLPCRMAA